MNSHFQSSDTAWTLSVLSSGASGLAGSSSCDPIQATLPTSMIVSSGKGPGDKFDLAGLNKARLEVGAPVGRSVPPSEQERRENGRNDDRDHDQGLTMIPTSKANRPRLPDIFVSLAVQRWPRSFIVGIYACASCGDIVSTAKLTPPAVEPISQLGTAWT